VATAASTGNPQVTGLVYVAAIVPDEKETVGEVFTRAAPHPKAPRLAPDGDGLLWITERDAREAVAHRSPQEATRIAAAQKPIAAACLGEPMGRPGWREKPSWFLIAEEDRMVAPETQRFQAERMRSTVTSVKADHLPLASHAEAIVAMIAAASAA
jgi:pimeloyl-ACP methyl ester carboxylesterase